MPLIIRKSHFSSLSDIYCHFSCSSLNVISIKHCRWRRQCVQGLCNFVCLRQSEAWVKTRITIFTKLVPLYHKVILYGSICLALELTIAKALFNSVKLPWARSIFFKNIITMEVELDSKMCQPCTKQASKRPKKIRGVKSNMQGKSQNSIRVSGWRNRW